RRGRAATPPSQAARARASFLMGPRLRGALGGAWGGCRESPVSVDTGATEDAARRRPARLGGTCIIVKGALGFRPHGSGPPSRAPGAVRRVRPPRARGRDPRRGPRRRGWRPRIPHLAALLGEAVP